MLSVLIDTERGRVTLPRYSFPARKTRVLERGEITEIIDWYPPAIVTTGREVLLASRMELEGLKAFCGEHGIPFTRRYDVWADLLDPFLDTELSTEDQAANRQRLKERGSLTDTEIDAIRAKVDKRMMWMTAATWEWQHYGLYDVLSAMKPKLFFGRASWRAFYAQAMEIALRSETFPGDDQNIDT